MPKYCRRPIAIADVKIVQVWHGCDPRECCDTIVGRTQVALARQADRRFGAHNRKVAHRAVRRPNEWNATTATTTTTAAAAAAMAAATSADADASSAFACSPRRLCELSAD